MQVIINKLASEGNTMEEINPIINLVRAFDNDVDYIVDSSVDEPNGYDKQARLNMAYKYIKHETPLPQEPLNPSPNPDETQWLDDALHSTNTGINYLKHINTVINNSYGYTRFIRKLQFKKEIQIKLLKSKHCMAPLPTPKNRPLYIPTHKCHIKANILRDTTWKDY